MQKKSKKNQQFWVLSVRDETKITAFSAERLTEEFEYVAKKVSSIKGGTKSTSIFDSNWGIFQKDVDLGSKIAKIMNKYDWPQHIETCTPKKNQENLFCLEKCRRI